jgi:type II secretory pathway pseudopilin PulG
MNPKIHPQSGQSLIETIVAIFILVTALVAGLGLALYAVTHSANAKNQIVATNLAREGIEVVRMVRDSNWLAAEDDNQIDDLTNCTFPNPAPNDVRPCYPETFDVNSLGGTYSNLNNGEAIVYYFINVRLESAALYSPFLCQQATGGFRPTFRIVGASCPIPVRYARIVNIATGNTAPPFTADSTNPSAAAGHSPEKIVTSTVVWQGRNCTPFPTDFIGMLLFNPRTFDTRCKIEITEHLTNWKDYQ